MNIKVLGTGCNNCKMLLEHTKKAVEELNIEADIEYITELKTIVQLGVVKTPALMVDQKIVSSGKVLDVHSLKSILLK
ncbi:redox-active disulfide protein 2 [Acholeplasma oculi]|uniref:Redox-active disulfide protein 2 n=1 Tax=Acholeplasma oculi TaxID=35623 RepID=A0A061AH67_9MOLU|nr:thioredoxin family protein [Acholeplasma oculi]CDR30307.1 Redox-active disulfide protein 2 [Acholeplasma oculi]SKC43117.1 small redox-active disulfide protein 2 [Acholeplasma oculi]SUT88765.1 redox-active disulfide protein 2 [Acholeplasma oculi]